MFVVFKATGLNSAFNINNSLFTGYQAAGEGVGSTVKITDLQVKLNQTRYSLDPMIQDPEHFNIFGSYNAYSEICKIFGNERQLNSIDFRNLYPIYCFDLNTQDENLVKNGIQIQLEIKKSSSESLTAYCLILEDISHVIKKRDQRKVLHKLASGFSVSGGTIGMVTGSSSLGTLVTGIGVPFAIPLGGISLGAAVIAAVCTYAMNKCSKGKEKYSKLIEKANFIFKRINLMISEALKDRIFSEDEYRKTIDEYELYRKDIRTICQQYRTKPTKNEEFLKSLRQTLDEKQGR